jgi:hypothetical protein
LNREEEEEEEEEENFPSTPEAKKVEANVKVETLRRL